MIQSRDRIKISKLVSASIEIGKFVVLKCVQPIYPQFLLQTNIADLREH